jgi:hydrogenase maturation protease
VHLVRDAFPDARGRASLKVVGIGNAVRADDAVGLAVVRELRGTLPAGVEVLEREGEPTSLIDAWEGADTVWLVDAVSSGATPGTVHRIDAADSPLPAGFGRTSTHHFGLPEAVELARVLGRLPERLIVYGVEGASFDTGDALSPNVAGAVGDVAEAIRTEVRSALS